MPTSAGSCAIRGRLVQGLASGPTASGPEALPTHRPRQTVEALVWLWRATSLTYACVRQRFDKMANMPSLSNTHTHTYLQHNSASHLGWKQREQFSYVYAIPEDWARPSSLQHTIRKNYATFDYFKQLCVVTQLRRPIYNSAVAEWTPRILFWVDREKASAAVGNTR